jgi:hypothetical protein
VLPARDIQVLEQLASAPSAVGLPPNSHAISTFSRAVRNDVRFAFWNTKPR